MPNSCIQENASPRMIQPKAMVSAGPSEPIAAVLPAPMFSTALAASQRLATIIGTKEAPVPPLNLVGDFGGGGMFSSVPFLNQYWHAYCLGGRVSGSVKGAGVDWQFDDARLYCERNWGAGFPQRWWWGEAHDFDQGDACVAFSGGLLELGPIHREVTGVVVRLGSRVLRITPPAPVSSRFDRDDWHWQISARTARFVVELDGSGASRAPHVLPVPVPAERRNIDTDYEFLAGTLRCTVREWGRVIFDGTSHLAALEVGDRPQ